MKLEIKFKNSVKKILIVHARFNDFIVKSLLEEAINALMKHQVEENDIDTLQVPGSYEIPWAINHVTNQKKYDGIIALGCIIQGETDHHEMIIQHLNLHLGKISIAKDIPLSLGILTAKNTNQALERAGIKMGNKGWEAAQSVIEMINLSELTI